MINRYLVIFFMTIFQSELYATPTVIGPFNFSGGYNLRSLETDLNENESRDMCNCIVDSDGGLTKINGTKKFIEQAYSTYPVVSIYRYYNSSGTSLNKTLIAVIGNSIVSSTGGSNPFWTILSSNVVVDENWNWLTFRNKAIGVSYNNRIKQFDLSKSSFTDLLSNVDNSTIPIEIRSKYILSSKNYLLLGNVIVSTSTDQSLSLSTAYPNRVYFSLLLDPSSFTWNRFLDYRTEDGESLTGLGNQFDAVHLFKPSSIGELTFSVLNLISQDVSLKEIVSDFGLEAPNTLAVRGGFYILGSKDGIRLWDGGRRQRASAGEELSIISRDIQPLIEKLIKANTYKKSVGKFYAKKDWYIFSYIDPEKFPKDKLNSIIIYDFKLGKWFPICGLNANSIEVFNGSGDFGELMIGSSLDSFVYQADIGYNFSRKEIFIDTMDSSFSWKNSSIDNVHVKEGSASLKISINNVTTQSSMTITKPIFLSEWHDKLKVSKEDKFSFKIFADSYTNISSLRVDLEVKDIDSGSEFDSNFTSVTLSSASISSDKTWTTFEIPLSSFPIRKDWIDLNTENQPFARSSNFYGIRFVLTGVNTSTVSIDDIRLVEATEDPIKFFWTSKMFSFGSISNKNFGQVLLSYFKTPESNLKLEFSNDFGLNLKKDMFDKDTNKEIILTRATSTIEVLSSIDFSVIKSTAYDSFEFFPLNGNSNKDIVVVVDRKKQRLMKIDKNKFGAIISTYGSLGSGINQFNTPHQIKIKGNSVFLNDENNHRIKEHLLSDFSFIKTIGNLGLETTSFHVPTGLSVNENDAFVANEGNGVITKLNLSTFGFVNDFSVDYNKIGDTSLEEDSKYLYLAYEKISPNNIFNVDLILEKRIKTTNQIVNRKIIRTENSVSESTYNIRGDIAIVGNNIFIAFTDDFTNPERSYFIQKLSKNDFSLIKQYKTKNKLFSLIGYSRSYLPFEIVERKNIGTIGKYIQVKYFDDENDNFVKLFNQTFLVDQTSISY